MIVVVGRFRLPPDQVERGRPLMEQVLAASLAEPGCLSYSYAQDIGEAGLFHVSETWASREALEAHFKTEHMLRWQQERAELGFHDREVTAYHAGSPVTL